MQACDFHESVLIETWVTVYTGDIGYTFHKQPFVGEFLRCRGTKRGRFSPYLNRFDDHQHMQRRYHPKAGWARRVYRLKRFYWVSAERHIVCHHKARHVGPVVGFHPIESFGFLELSR